MKHRRTVTPRAPEVPIVPTGEARVSTLFVCTLATVVAVSSTACTAIECQLNAGKLASETDVQGCIDDARRREDERKAARDFPKRRARARAVASEACARGDRLACFDAATLGDGARDVDISTLEHYQSACTSDDVLSQRWNIGLRRTACLRGAELVIDGRVIVDNPAERLALLLDRACSLSAKSACALMSSYSSSDTERLFYAERACALGFRASCYEAGGLYERGIGPGDQRARARSRYKRACDAANSSACLALADLDRRDRESSVEAQ